MSSWAVLAASAGGVTIVASATGIVTLATAVRSLTTTRRRMAVDVERAAARQFELQLEIVQELARRNLLASAGAGTEVREAVAKSLAARLAVASGNPQESELLSERLRSVARDLEAEADSIAVVGAAHAEGSDSEPGQPDTGES